MALKAKLKTAILAVTAITFTVLILWNAIDFIPGIRGRTFDALTVAQELLEDYVSNNHGAWPENWDNLKSDQKAHGRPFGSALGHFEMPADFWKIQAYVDIDFSYNLDKEGVGNARVMRLIKPRFPSKFKLSESQAVFLAQALRKSRPKNSLQ